MQKQFKYKVPNLQNSHCVLQMSQPDIEKSKEDDVIQLEIDSYFMDGNSTNVKIFFNTIKEFEKFKDTVNDAFLTFSKFNSMDDMLLCNHDNYRDRCPVPNCENNRNTNR